MIILQKLEDCCGCTACVQICPKECISMQFDKEGFDYPIIDITKCIDCGLCNKVCPVINQGEEKKPITVYAAKSKRNEIRMQSSSGGIFTELAEQTINQGGVVFGVRFDEQWNVIHDYTSNIEGLEQFRGSKYVQSQIGDSYKNVEQFLKQNKEVLFSGTPCQIAGLKKYLKKEYDNLLLVDIVCHGVPSPLVWKDYLKNILTKNNVTISSISFRDKCIGWKRFSFATHYKNNICISEPLDINVFMQGFLKDLYLRPSCYACPAKKGKSHSDITIADYWGINQYLPEFDDDKGISLIMVNTGKGQSKYDLLAVQNIETTYEQALSHNSSIEHSVAIPKLRKYFWSTYSKIGLKAITKTCNKLKPSFTSRAKSSIIRRIKTLIGKKIFKI